MLLSTRVLLITFGRHWSPLGTFLQYLIFLGGREGMKASNNFQSFWSLYCPRWQNYLQSILTFLTITKRLSIAYYCITLYLTFLQYLIFLGGRECMKVKIKWIKKCGFQKKIISKSAWASYDGRIFASFYTTDANSNN